MLLKPGTSLCYGLDTILIVVGRDECRERYPLEVGFDGSNSSYFGDTNWQWRELAQEIQRCRGCLHLSDGQRSLLLGRLAVFYEIVAVMRLTQHS